MFTADRKADLPSIQDLLDLERTAQKQGSGIVADDLTADRKLFEVWDRSGKRGVPGTSLLLRAIGARLILCADAQGFSISNQVNLGTLRLRFQGRAFLQGSRPNLMFGFQMVHVTIAGLKILHRNLSDTSKSSAAFFSLIALDRDQGWLAGRGRGGGLALWIKQSRTGQ